jgi:hypothetical protein
MRYNDFCGYFQGNFGLENRSIDEASGLAASLRHPDVLWIINDSGDDPVLYAMDTGGAHLGRVTVRNARNVDWEDLAAFCGETTSYLLIADVGDNRARRDECLLYLVPEPDIADLQPNGEISVALQRRLRFVYEDGPRDCEAVAVDQIDRKILLLTKRLVPPVLYELPLAPEDDRSLLIARRLAVIETIPPPSLKHIAADPRFGNVRSHPTAMDISRDGAAVVVLTYGAGYLYRRPAGLPWPTVFRHPPALIRMPKMPQAESICFSPDGTAMYVTSEQLPALLYRLVRSAQ